MKKYEIEEGLKNDLIAIIENGVHPNIPFKALATIRQKLIMSREIEDANRTDSADDKATG